MKWIKFAITICLIVGLAALSACHSKKADEPEPPREPASRTVLVYMVASNNMGSGGWDAADLDEMLAAAKAGDLGQGRLLVYHAPHSGNPTLKEVTANGIDTLKMYNTDQANVSKSRLSEAIADMKALAPAGDYGIIFWSHGTGWIQDGIAEEAPAGMAYSFGSDKGKKMNVTSMAQALEDAGMSFIYFDCCYMGSIEVMYQMRNAAPVIASSPTEDPIAGMPYDKTLRHFFLPAKADLIGAGKEMFDHYMLTYQRYDCPVTMTVVNTAALDELAAATADLYASVETPKPADYDPQKYSADRTCYYFDFEDYVKALGASDEAMARWADAYAKVVTYKAYSDWIWGEVPITRCGGLSTYILSDPASAAIKGYSQLCWYADVASKFFE